MTSSHRYLEMAEELESELQHIPVGSRVPSEHALASRFGVSRPTARAALQELERRLLVQRVQGRGTFRRGRLDYVISPAWPPSFSETLRRAGGVPGVRMLSVTVRRAVEQECRRLSLPAASAVWAVERIFTVNGEVAAYATSVLPHRLLPGLDAALTGEPSLATALRRRYGIAVQRMRYRISLASPPQAVADQLTVDRTPIWLAESVNRCAGGPPVETARTYMRADVLDISFEMEERTL
ncbi:GntR family transcriptional regulator [Spongiactinospora sp. TRM90649]|uniref:GntR family transcriptional regulator n=1 Tax=Spongiactinospora sp. TRM90649 TaxID=3031114 RepID=UPI0023F829B8|nr:GntR family transcriptional regulator [Spongiactinospora sp. TRM90649]MDF5757075.1 GntR family transcriptional regulator [Spongiactinospora sp. TRM90649]